MAEQKAYLTTRVDWAFKKELEKACGLEHRSLSNFSRLLLEYGWSHYLRAGSLRQLLAREIETNVRSE